MAESQAVKSDILVAMGNLAYKVIVQAQRTTFFYFNNNFFLLMWSFISYYSVHELNKHKSMFYSIKN